MQIMRLVEQNYLSSKDQYKDILCGKYTSIPHGDWFSLPPRMVSPFLFKEKI